MRSIVVGIDGRQEVEPALDLAVDEAVRRRLPLAVVHTYGAPRYGQPAVGSPGSRQLGQVGYVGSVQRATAALGRSVSRVEAGATVKAELVVSEGDPAAVLLSVAATSALLVVGSRGGGPLRQAARGSVSLRCLHDSIAPVAVVPDGAQRSADRWLRSRVIVGVDGSTPSLSALAWATAQAREWGSVLVPVVVSSLTGSPPLGLLPHGGTVHELETALWDHVRTAGGANLEVHPRFVEGKPQNRLMAITEPSDLLVLGTRGRAPVVSALTGSASIGTAERASCPVVVVRDGQARREIHQRPLGSVSPTR